MNFLKQYSLFFAIVVAFFLFRRGCWSDFGVFRKSVQGTGEMLQEARPLHNFTNVGNSSSLHVEIFQDSVFAVEIDAQKEIAAVIETFVEENTLKIRVKKGFSIGLYSDATIRVRLPQLTQVSQSGSGDIFCKGNLKSPKIVADLAGSGSIHFENAVIDEFSVDIAGSGHVICNAGSAVKGNVSIAGSGGLKSENFVIQTMAISIAGSGSAACNTEVDLSVSISGSGSVRYKGNAKASSSISGSGSVLKL